MTTLHDSQLQFVESLAIHYEGQGLSPVAGRILGRLLIAETSEQSSKQLADWIGASKGSISSQTQFLIQAGFLDKVRRPGSRETWYRLKDGVWMDLMLREAETTGYVRKLVDTVLAAQENAGVEPLQTLVDYRSICAFFERKFPQLIDEWAAERAQS